VRVVLNAGAGDDMPFIDRVAVDAPECWRFVPDLRLRQLWGLCNLELHEDKGGES